jgi:hypothetical protein
LLLRTGYWPPDIPFDLDSLVTVLKAAEDMKEG